MNDTKSYSRWFLGLYSATLSDVAEYFPSLRADCERDYKRLLSAVENHGVTFILDTMVAYAKHFDKCLANGRLTPSHLCQFGGYNRRTPIPRLFKGLMLRVFGDSGELRSDPDVQAIRSLRQLMCCFKGFRIACPNSRTYESVQEFFKTDDEVRLPSLNWAGDRLSDAGFDDLQFGDLLPAKLPLLEGRAIPPRDEGVLAIERMALSVVQRTADIATSFFGRFDPTEWRTRHGPGAVSDLRGNRINKYDFPQWPERLERVFPVADFAFANYDHWVHSIKHEEWFHECNTSKEPFSRLIAVPKTFRGPRLIASEPTAHQWCQQSVRDFLMSRVQDTPIGGAISFRDQSPSQRLVLGASQSGSHATIDLSMASDRISCWVVERLFRRSPSLLQALHSCRTRWIRQDLDRRLPRFLELRKFTTMGSAVTFPVQTILFTVVAASAVLLCRKLKPTIANVRRVCKEVQVFGDDIIVPVDAWKVTVALLTTLGLRVNDDKTFGHGMFRESCGMDAFNGHNVSRVSILSEPSVSAPENVLSCVDVANNLLMGGWFKTSHYVRKTVEGLGRYSFPNVAPFSGVIGWITFGEVDNSHLRSRWNWGLSQREYRFSLPRAGIRRCLTDKTSLLLQYFTEAAPAAFVEGDRLGIVALKKPLRLREGWAPLPG
ncbi:MAG: putative replicase protein [Leviviridae sp.]|nr:MAG: putative replicase protein [Leviviridae sp.]